jgi:hypothetical protein
MIRREGGMSVREATLRRRQYGGLAGRPMMSGNGGGSFAAILLSIPLSAVALMSVFGVPKLSKIVSSIGSDSDSDDESDSRSRSRRRVADQEDEFSIDDAEPWDEAAHEEDSFGRSKRPRPVLARASREESDDFGSGRDDFATRDGDESSDESELASDRPRSRKNSGNPFEPTNSVTQADFRTSTGGQRSDFAGAIRRLATLKVDHWNLEPGLTSGQFLFVCIVDPNATSGTIHRFEAENRDPTAAVDDVIQQISEWRSESTITRSAATESSR